MRRPGFVIAALTLAGVTCSCSQSAAERTAAQITGGEPARGAAAIQKYGCPACHTIPGIDGAQGLVGPPLAGIASRVYIAGVLANTPDNLVRWIRSPKEVDEKTAMPDAGVTARDARDIAAYLYTLK